MTFAVFVVLHNLNQIEFQGKDLPYQPILAAGVPLNTKRSSHAKACEWKKRSTEFGRQTRIVDLR
jgi:hypothetical protein